MVPFAILMLQTDLSPSPDEVARRVRVLIVAEAGPIGNDSVVRPTRRTWFSFDGDKFSLSRLSPLTCRVIFGAALETDSYLLTAGRGSAAMVMRGSSGKPPADLSPAILVDSPAALCKRLSMELTAWNRDIGKAQAGGFLDAQGQPIGPSADPPASSARVEHDGTGVEAECDHEERGRMANLGWKIVRSLVTDEPKWGIVWRADLATGPDTEHDLWREVCWAHRKGRNLELETSSQALDPFDPAQALAPLPAR